MKKARLFFVMLGLSAASLYACSKKPLACAPGQQSSCPCATNPNGGVQVCAADGQSFGACQCGTTATTAGSGGMAASSTSSMGPGATGTAGFGGGGPQGVGGGGQCDVGDCNKCQQSQCAIQACKQPYDDCMADMECKALVTCGWACMTNDFNCFNGCFMQHQAGGMKFLPLFKCYSCNPGVCKTDCPTDCSKLP